MLLMVAVIVAVVLQLLTLLFDESIADHPLDQISSSAPIAAY